MFELFLRYLRYDQVRGGMWLCVSVLLSIVLYGYYPFDASFDSATSHAIHHSLGSWGAVVSDIFFQIFGVSSCLIPIISFGIGIRTFMQIRYRSLVFEVLLIVLTTLFASILSNVVMNFWSLIYNSYLVSFENITQKSSYISHAIRYMETVSGLKLYGIVLNMCSIDTFSKPTQYFIYFVATFGFYFSLCMCLGIRGLLRIKFPFQWWYSILNTVTNLSTKNSMNIVVDKPVKVAKQSGVSRKKNHNDMQDIVSYKLDEFQLPGFDLLNNMPSNKNVVVKNDFIREQGELLLSVLEDFGVQGNIVGINTGPVVTLYEFEPSAGTKSSRVIGLADDIARSISALSTRISVVPGRNALGIEIPNKQRQFFSIYELLHSEAYGDLGLKLPIILGKDLCGEPCVVDLAKMPHLLVAGTTGSGKSVAINTMILSLLYRHTPDECRFIMIDPKMLELSIYDGIPHLLCPVVTDPSKAVVALKWAVKEMENRYRLMSQLNVRNIYGYNDKIDEAIVKGEPLKQTVQSGFDPETGRATFDSIDIPTKRLPFIVVIVDEMADLMLVAGKEIEGSIQRLAQMARAAGIHIIMATQRPSVDVITGVIKANFPSRVSFKVTSKIDSRTILGEPGAEQLLGMGDMLYMGNSSKIIRVHGPFVDDKEVERVATFLKSQGEPEYVTSVTESSDEEIDVDSGDTSDDGLYKQAVQIVLRDKKPSTSYVQRSLRIGYNRAAIIIERMEREGLITPPNHTGKREIVE